MTDKQPEALRQAAWLKKEGASCQRHYDLGVLIERQHTELETLRAKLKTYEDLGDAADDVQLLRMGYDAARLEIESLQARIKTMAEEHADELMVAHMAGRSQAAQQPAPSGAVEVKLEPVYGDVLPPVGSRVFIRHGFDNDAHAAS